MAARLSVNVNKLATLRNARGGNRPDLVATSRDIIRFGAQGITVHPRPDARHIRRDDVMALSDLIREENSHRDAEAKLEFNVEGYPNGDFLGMIEHANPDQCTLVPDPPEAITSNAGWALQKNREALIEAVGQLRSMGVRTSLFIDPFTIDASESEALLQVRPDRIELYTESFASNFGGAEQDVVTEKYKEVALQFYDLGIGINAGHDLNQQNLAELIRNIPVIEEVSIGHALICEALYQGLEQTINNYLILLKNKS